MTDFDWHCPITNTIIIQNRKYFLNYSVKQLMIIY